MGERVGLGMGVWFLGGYLDHPHCGDTLHTAEVLRYGTFFTSIALHLLLRPLVGYLWSDFQLNPIALKTWDRAGFVRQTALCLQSAMLHSVLGPLAIYLSAIQVSTEPVSQGITCSPQLSAASVTSFNNGIYVGSVFAGWAMFQCLWLVLGWEKGGPSMWVHHIMFAAISTYTPYLNVLAELSLFAAGMEASTPALELMLTLRSVDGYDAITQSIAIVFTVVFITTRVFWFGYGLMRSLSFWVDPEPEVLAGLGDRVGPMLCLQGLFFLGWLMQLVWAKSILVKARKVFKRTEPNRKKD